MKIPKNILLKNKRCISKSLKKVDNIFDESNQDLSEIGGFS